MNGWVDGYVKKGVYLIFETLFLDINKINIVFVDFFSYI